MSEENENIKIDSNLKENNNDLKNDLNEDEIKKEDNENSLKENKKEIELIDINDEIRNDIRNKSEVNTISSNIIDSSAYEINSDDNKGNEDNEEDEEEDNNEDDEEEEENDDEDDIDDDDEDEEDEKSSISYSEKKKKDPNHAYINSKIEYMTFLDLLEKGDYLYGIEQNKFYKIIKKNEKNLSSS